jgi:diphthamide synthase (EF-2-diphthine--ammonia ligase)
MNLKDIVLSNIGQTLKDKYCVISLIRGTYKSQTQNQRVEQCCQDLGGEG